MTPRDDLAARVADAQALAAAATPGPWGIMGGHNDYWIQAFDGGCVDGWPTGKKIVQLETWEPATKQGDAKLIAAAPDLVALVAELWAALEEREADMHARIRQGYDTTVADSWRAHAAKLLAERDEARAALATPDGHSAAVSAVLTEEVECLRAENARLRTAVSEALALAGDPADAVGGYLRAAWVPLETARRWRLALGEATTGPTWGEHCAGLGDPATTTKED